MLYSGTYSWSLARKGLQCSGMYRIDGNQLLYCRVMCNRIDGNQWLDGFCRGSLLRNSQTLRSCTVDVAVHPHVMTTPYVQLVYLPGQRVQLGPNKVSDSPVSAEKEVYEAFVEFGGGMRFLYIAYMEKKKKVETSPFFILPIFSTFPCLQESNAVNHHFSLSKQWLPKSQFLQKLSCQKPYWEQARLSSLVYKQVVLCTPAIS